MRGNEEDAPIPAVRMLMVGRLESTLLRRSRFRIGRPAFGDSGPLDARRQNAVKSSSGSSSCHSAEADHEIAVERPRSSPACAALNLSGFRAGHLCSVGHLTCERVAVLQVADAHAVNPFANELGQPIALAHSTRSRK